MKRLAVALGAVALLMVGSAAAAFAQTPQNQWQSGWGCPGWGGGANGSYEPSSNPTIKRLADAIGIGANDLVSELQAGKSVLEVAQASNVGEQTLVDTLLAPQVDSLNLRVKYGYLTQEQADSALEYQRDLVKSQLGQKGGFGGGYGMMGPGYGMMGPGYGMMGPGYGGSGMMGPGYGGSGMMGSGFRGRSY